MRLHDLGHGAATLAHAAGTDPKDIQEMLGHSSITITADTYTRACSPKRTWRSPRPQPGPSRAPAPPPKTPPRSGARVRRRAASRPGVRAG
ncbi:tyrosine-type recombinase/integrase [Streptomyces sp. NPDC005271]|uniref:tyrosine-type recombinase/integrase n=1 Tax=unclassified Streptomyces TaxID=2593676 RepID=UPI0033A331C1